MFTSTWVSVSVLTFVSTFTPTPTSVSMSISISHSVEPWVILMGAEDGCPSVEAGSGILRNLSCCFP